MTWNTAIVGDTDAPSCHGKSFSMRSHTFGDANGLYDRRHLL